MTIKINPFRPNSAVPPGMFAGRWTEVQRLESGLNQTRAGHPGHFMLTGERGIGKTSLLNYIRWLAAGDIIVNEELNFKYLVIDTDVDAKTTQFGLIKKIELCIRWELGKTESAKSFLSDAWEFIQRIEALGVKLNEPSSIDRETLLDEFAHSLAKTVERLCDGKETEDLFSAKYDGVLILADESDNASVDLDFGVFLKQLLERLQRHRCEKVMVILAGLPELESVVRDSHPSALRLFEHLRLNRLLNTEVNEVIDLCLAEAKEKNGVETLIEENARELLMRLAEGFPHFIQQFGYSAFDVDDNNNIEVSDVMDGAFGNDDIPGALKLIGDRYYRNDFYNKIQKESYRQVLRIMANEDNTWVSKRTIRSKFKGKVSTLDNAIKALRDRHIILSKEGVRGVYGLQHRGFALWIKLFATPRSEIAIEKYVQPEPS